MKKIIHILFVILFVAVAGACDDDISELGELTAPSNIQLDIQVEANQTGRVTFTPSADNVITFHLFFGDDPEAAPTVLTPGKSFTYRYTRSGEYTVLASVVAFGEGGTATSVVQPIDLNVRLFIDDETLMKIAGGGTKTWVWDQAVAGHFGVGPPDGRTPDFFSAQPNEMPSDCLYDDRLTFSYDANDNYSYELVTNNTTFINWAVVQSLFPDANPQQFVDECRDINTGDLLPTSTSFVILTDAETGVQTITLGGSFMSYYSDIQDWEILELTDDRLSVRGLQNNGELAWYFSFVPEGSSTGGSQFNTLVWSDEFDVAGAPDPTKWGYDIGTGENGWGNQESQYYTDRTDNVVVSDGTLKITARAESFSGSQYTSARINTKDLFEFTHGRIEARAKLPTAEGTWPAIWMLGADFETNIWPAAGEIDIMEHIGNDLGRILGSTHSPSGFAGNSNTGRTTVTDVTEWHVYSVEWTSDGITFMVDGTAFFTYNPAVKNDSTYPFNKDFFIIMNVAMGGTLGGAIDGAFTTDTMEIDYIRVYQ